MWYPRVTPLGADAKGGYHHARKKVSRISNLDEKSGGSEQRHGLRRLHSLLGCTLHLLEWADTCGDLIRNPRACSHVPNLQKKTLDVFWVNLLCVALILWKLLLNFLKKSMVKNCAKN